ncbi:AraC family transcriptional regulator [Robbsia sp. KACC 23696]|uniref:AraC family transcriptional regulator n=1 Tax=Robbsia sp. KACC 23696 TaxID=3149231 RepID=UPI00325ADD4A
MVDPLAEVVTLLQPRTQFAKVVLGASPWRIYSAELNDPFYCAMLEGGCHVTVEGTESITLMAGDFMLVPSRVNIYLSSLDALPSGVESAPPCAIGSGEYRLGDADRSIDARIAVGHCQFGSPDANLLVSLLPKLVHVRNEPRLATLVQFIRDETREKRPAREVVLARLIELLLIEALRSGGRSAASPGLVRGLADARLAAAIRGIHARPTHAWTVAALAKEAALSRTTFFERFQQALGVTPMDYLLGWRMALAKDMLRRREGRVAEIATRVGYGSASTFSVAFTRYVGVPPSHFARDVESASHALLEEAG